MQVESHPEDQFQCQSHDDAISLLSQLQTDLSLYAQSTIPGNKISHPPLPSTIIKKTQIIASYLRANLPSPDQLSLDITKSTVNPSSSVNPTRQSLKHLLNQLESLKSLINMVDSQ